MLKKDVLIIGQGLAGSLLAWQLHQRGLSFTVVDLGGVNASRVAAGLINPVTGKRLVIQPDVENLLPIALTRYREIEQALGLHCYTPQTMLRLLFSDDECEQARHRQQQAGGADFLATPEPAPDGIRASHGVVQQRQAGWLNTRALLQGLKNWLITEGSYQEGQMDIAALNPDEPVSFRGTEHHRVIFCEGYRMQQNPWFRWLPLEPAKGEIVTARSHQPLPDAILNFGQWLIPLGGDRFRTGAGYQREPRDETPNVTAVSQLLHRLEQVCPATIGAEPVRIEAGIRPATRDRMPFCGPHPRYPRLLVFNGFGSKGSLFIPWCCDRLGDWLLEGVPLPETISIERFHHLHGAD